MTTRMTNAECVESELHENLAITETFDIVIFTLLVLYTYDMYRAES